MTELAISTVSPSPTRILWSRLAIRDSAAIGSPCEPVQIRVALLAGSFSSSLSGDDEARRDVEVAEVAGDAHVADHRAADERDLAAVRWAASSTCWMRCTWLAKLETMIRRGAVAEDLLDGRGQVALGRS